MPSIPSHDEQKAVPQRPPWMARGRLWPAAPLEAGNAANTTTAPVRRHVTDRRGRKIPKCSTQNVNDTSLCQFLVIFCPQRSIQVGPGKPGAKVSKGKQ